MTFDPAQTLRGGIIEWAAPSGPPRRCDVSTGPTRRIFLSYRRDDVPPYVRLLKDHLSRRIPGAQVFMDIDSVSLGVDFADKIRTEIESSDALVAVIGAKWMGLTDEPGKSRLDDPDDYVRFEIRTAMVHGVPVIPVLVDGARPFRRDQMPAEIDRFAGLNALELTHLRFDDDIERLARDIQQAIENRVRVARMTVSSSDGAGVTNWGVAIQRLYPVVRDGSVSTDRIPIDGGFEVIAEVAIGGRLMGMVARHMLDVVVVNMTTLQQVGHATFEQPLVPTSTALRAQIRSGFDPLAGTSVGDVLQAQAVYKVTAGVDTETTSAQGELFVVSG
ncbi:toll/interleukin-1 receptor domain-containing protein [Virgisporangium aurantiacum]|uniref:TIR domain-containing protein n=1 Tax=Virgisporangium aurantiacum TaxID=175570 RepID=A0A8J3ZLZ9_9ACTN|nr:toll/interleukin-1 receptor domain-containing protein [Virgisporangium aurantiacum]GIJ63860.1 hypothetical protein Vau01_113760 [Virgisporangium aurantiacum]